MWHRVHNYEFRLRGLIVSAMRTSIVMQVVIIMVTTCASRADESAARAPSLNRCGPNSLYVYLHAMNAAVSLSDLERSFSDPGSPTTVEELHRLCEQHGVPSAVKRFTVEDTAAMPFPAIAYLPPRKKGDPGHFIVMLKYEDERMAFVDGTSGELRKWHHSTLWRQWKESGIAIVPEVQQFPWAISLCSVVFVLCVFRLLVKRS